jgi:predicted dehydrogenase
LSVCAQGRVVTQAREGYTVKIPDFLQVLGVWPQQIYGCLEWSGVAQFAQKDTLRIYGTEGVLIYDFVNDDIFAGQHGSNALDSIQIPKEYEKEWTVEDDFIKAVKNGGKPEPSYETGVRYMQVVEAINCSLRENRWVELSTI